MMKKSAPSVRNLPDMIDELLQKPYWVVDSLPFQVPENSSGQFFAVEQFYLKEAREASLRQKFTDILLKVNCYYDLLVFPEAGDESVKNPEPETLSEWLSVEHTALNVLIESERTLITWSSGSTNLTVFDPTEAILDLIRKLAGANGLFVWKPPQQE